MSAVSDVRLLIPAQVAAMFRVDRKTVLRWSAAGRLLSVRTPGNHRRYFEAEVDALLRGVPPEEARKLGLAEQARLCGGGP